ncbi:MAG: GTP pyrophosphokinase [Oscillospiraceae bacterium]|nr:GTP pyrophosphokinase [Oscillospiraceae bacterium]
MLYTPATKMALRLCFQAHRDQLDKGGMPYVFHPFHLAEQMLDEDTTVLALLHDVVEDTPYTLADLARMGFPQKVLEALALMTHDPAIPYMDYVAKIKANPLARAVKLADLRHNSDITRLEHVDARTLARIEKYRQAMELLESE